LLIANPEARSVPERAPEVKAFFEEAGCDIVTPSAFSRDAVADAVRKHRAAVDAVIAVGGDGTLNAVLQGLARGRVPLGIVPLGTANDLAKTLGIPLELKAACEVVLGGVTRRIDVGRVNDVYYFNEAGIGLSTAVSRSLRRDVKVKYGVFALVINFFRVVRRMRRFTAHVTCDGAPHKLRTAQLTVGNSKHFGGFVASDEAAIDDRMLDLYSVELDHWWSYFEALWALANRRYDEARCVFTLHGREFRVVTKKPRAIEADGEIVAKTPALIRVVPQAVSVFVPAPANGQ
jgi:diacylglycerol kinase (ATP)